MCVQLNKACCRLYHAFEVKTAIYFTNLSFIKTKLKSIPGKDELFATVGSIEQSIADRKGNK